MDLNEARLVVIKLSYFLRQLFPADLPRFYLPCQCCSYFHHTQGRARQSLSISEELLDPARANFLVVAFHPGTGIKIVEDHRRSCSRSFEAGLPFPCTGVTRPKSVILCW